MLPWSPIAPVANLIHRSLQRTGLGLEDLVGVLLLGEGILQVMQLRHLGLDLPHPVINPWIGTIRYTRFTCCSRCEIVLRSSATNSSFCFSLAAGAATPLSLAAEDVEDMRKSTESASMSLLFSSSSRMGTLTATGDFPIPPELGEPLGNEKK